MAEKDEKTALVTKEETPKSSNADARMTFTEHLGELRTRLVRSAIAVTLGFFICFYFAQDIMQIVSRPLRDVGTRDEIRQSADEESEGRVGDPESIWLTLHPFEGFWVSVKLATYGSILLVLPYLLYNICAFVFPGLTAQERLVVRILLFGCSILALTGVGIAYFGVFRVVLPYLLEWTPDWVNVQLRLNETISLILKGLFGFAIAFQFPMAVLILVYMGLLTPQTLKQHRRLAIVGMFAVGALLTPPDPFSMAMMALPLVVLYEISIVLASVVVWRKKVSTAGVPEEQ